MMLRLQNRCKEPSKKNEEIDIFSFTTFLEEVKEDYQNGGLQLPLIKYKVCWFQLVQHHDDIQIQVESTKRRKIEESGAKRRLSAVSIHNRKENLNSQAIPA
ncbi:unnamed protein product [Rhizophagus irregularis]|nr:unnamed protein product [Rhizophagus irregularis]